MFEQTYYSIDFEGKKKCKTNESLSRRTFNNHEFSSIWNFCTRWLL
jgi:hypothetical protein